MPTYQAVIARFQEDLQWIEKLKIPWVIYNKGPDTLPASLLRHSLQRPNVGRESETFLHHIVENYHQLPDYLVLLQGNPLEHCPGLFSILESHRPTQKVIPLSANYKRELITEDFNWGGFHECMDQMFEFIQVKRPSSIGYASGAQYIVPQKVIQARPQEFYQKLIPKLNYDICPLEGWVMERMWPTVFGIPHQTDKIKFDIVFDGPLTSACESSLARSIQFCREAVRTQVQDDIEFDVTIFENKRKGYEHALNAGKDFIYFSRSDSFFPDSYLFDSMSSYFHFKNSQRQEPDVVLASPEGLLTSHSVLLQHGDLLSEGMISFDALTQLWEQRQVPFVTPIKN